MTTIGSALSLFGVAAVLTCAAPALQQQEAVVLKQSSHVELIRRTPEQRETVGVPHWSHLESVRVSSGATSTLVLAMAAAPPASTADSHWVEVFWGQPEADGYWQADPKVAVYIQVSGQPNDASLAGRIKPLEALVWQEGRPMRRTEASVEGNVVRLDLGIALVEGLAVGQASSHWIPKLGGKWREPQEWVSPVSWFALKDRALMRSVLNFPGLAYDDIRRLPIRS